MHRDIQCEKHPIQHSTLLDGGIGNVKIIGERLTDCESNIASKLLSWRPDKFKLDDSIGSIAEVSAVLKKLATWNVEVRRPKGSQEFMMITSFRVSSAEVELKFNEQYKSCKRTKVSSYPI